MDSLINWARQSDLSGEAAPSLLAARAAMADKLGRHPIYRQYIRHLDRGLTGGSPRNREPWHALGERLYAMWLCANAGLSGSGIRLKMMTGGDDPLTAHEGVEDEEHVAFGMSLTMAGAMPYLWSDAMERTADSAPLPTHVVSRELLPMPVMFWSREVAYGTAEWETNWLMLMHAGEQVRIVGDVVNLETREMVIQIGGIPYGWTWPDQFQAALGDAEIEGIGRILRRCAFLNSPYVGTDKFPIPRPRRREMRRLGIDEREIEEQISVVTLRRAVTHTGSSPTDEHGGITWRHHWWVSGHYRAQWYPGEQAHKVIWVAPHLKGPRDKPLLEKVYAVVR